MELNEAHWYALSHFLDMYQLVKLFSNQKNRVTFERCKGTVLLNMFTILQKKLERDKTMGLTLIVKGGFVPFVRNDHNYHDFVYGFTYNHTWQELSTVPSVKLMRYFWDALFRGLPLVIWQKIEDILRNIVNLLPREESTICSKCKWVLPSSSMEDLHVCEYCHGYNTTNDKENFLNAYIKYNSYTQKKIL